MITPTFESRTSYTVWGLPGTILWGCVVLSTFFAIQIVVGIVYLISNPSLLGSADGAEAATGLIYSDKYYLLSGLASVLICVPLILGIVKLKKNSNFKKYLGLIGFDFSTYKYWMLSLFSLLVIFAFAGRLFSDSVVPEFMERVYTNADSVWFLGLAFVVTAPVFEEIFIRGFLLAGLSATVLGEIGAVIITSAVWTAMHTQYEWYLLVQIFVLGVVLGNARIKSGSIYLTIVLHATWNTMALLLTMFYLQT